MPNMNDSFDNLTNTPDSTSQFDPKDIADNKVLAAIGYLGFLFLVPLLAAPNSKYARFHANQGLVLFIFMAAYAIIVSILSFILGFIPVIGWIIRMVLWLLYLVFVALMVLGIVNAATGKAKQLPVIGSITILK